MAMVTLRKTEQPMHTMTIDQLIVRAVRYDAMSRSSERWGRHADATAYAMLANHCDDEAMRRMK